MYIYFPMYHNEISDSEPEVIETQYGCVTPESEEKCEKKDGLTGSSSSISVLLATAVQKLL